MKTESRNFGVDLAKIVAAIFVPMIHHFRFAGFYEKNIAGVGMFLYTMEFGVLMSCVPIFLVISGMVLRNRKIDKNHYIKLLDFVVLSLTLHILGVLIRWGFEGFSYSAKELLIMTLNIPYFITMYIQIYCLAPFINLIFDNINSKEKKIFVLVCIFIFAIPQFINKGQFNILYTGWQSAYAFMYYVIGAYIRDEKVSLKLSNGFVILLVNNLIYASLIFLINNGRAFSHSFGHYNGIFTVVNTFVIVATCQSINIKRDYTKKIVPLFASVTIGNYLIGATSIENVLNKWFITNNFKVDMLLNPLKAIISFLICSLITFFVMKWISNLNLSGKLLSKKNSNVL